MAVKKKSRIEEVFGASVTIVNPAHCASVGGVSKVPANGTFTHDSGVGATVQAWIETPLGTIHGVPVSTSDPNAWSFEFSGVPNNVPGTLYVQVTQDDGNIAIEARPVNCHAALISAFKRKNP